MAKVKARQIKSTSLSSANVHITAIIKEFEDKQSMHEFFNKQYDNSWQEYLGELKAGKYIQYGYNGNEPRWLTPKQYKAIRGL